MFLDDTFYSGKHLKYINKLTKLTNPFGYYVNFSSSYIRPHYGYRVIIFGQACNDLVHETLDWNQYNVSLVIADTMRDTLKEKLYRELGFKSLQRRR